MDNKEICLTLRGISADLKSEKIKLSLVDKGELPFGGAIDRLDNLILILYNE